ncbi:MAG: helix-turn-helix transcriptional regulator [Clostridia bacterium]|nr:helix-turn-helix transcriptional regulator [Clostridia bacterium]
MSYNELKQHGTEDFPFELYEIDENHPKYEMAFHWHSAMELVIVYSGKLDLTLNNRQFTVYPDELVVVNSEFIHGGTPTDCKYECLVFNISFLKTGNHSCDSFIDDLINRHCIFNEKIKEKTIVDTAKRLFSALRERDDGFKFMVIGLAHELIGTLYEKKNYTYDVVDLTGKDDKNVLKLKKVLAFIRENFDREITIDDMARSADLSTNYFCSFFKEMTDKTPIAYLNVYRIERAARKLLGTDMTVTQIAYSCGFNDLSYFIKTFKEIKNTTPSKYRRNISS